MHCTASFLSDPYLALLDDVRAKRHGFDAESLGRFKRLDAILSPHLIVVILTSLSRHDRAALLTRKVGGALGGSKQRHSGTEQAGRRRGRAGACGRAGAGGRVRAGGQTVGRASAGARVRGGDGGSGVGDSKPRAACTQE